MTNDEEIRRGHEAERLMNEPLIKEALAKIEDGIVSSLKSVAVGDTKSQQDYVLTLQALESFKRHFKTCIETGKLARMHKESLADKAKRYIRAA